MRLFLGIDGKNKFIGEIIENYDESRIYLDYDLLAILSYMDEENKKKDYIENQDYLNIKEIVDYCLNNNINKILMYETKRARYYVIDVNTLKKNYIRKQGDDWREIPPTKKEIAIKNGLLSGELTGNHFLHLLRSRPAVKEDLKYLYE